METFDGMMKWALENYKWSPLWKAISKELTGAP